MFKKLVTNAVKERVGTSKVVDTVKEVYDYIIVGAGAAGNVLASRLTEDGQSTVLLLEAGGDDAQTPAVHMPTAAAELQQSEYNYNYKTVTQERACRGMNEQQALYPRGRGLGGSSSINYMSYTRGSRYDFDEWAELGCDGWSYKEVLPYFMISEDNANEEYVKSGYHGKGGPMKIEDMARTPLVGNFLEAGAELGYDILDVNGANQLGFANQQACMHNGMRWSTAHAYLRPAMDRDNLDVSIKSIVSKVLFEDNQVTGVHMIKDGQDLKVKARKEVIISAGAVESPKILMLSGIGPSDHLNQFKIPIRADLPVGNNLQDHPMCLMEYIVERPPSINVDASHEVKSSKDYQQFLFFTKGYLGMPGAQGGVAFFRSRLAPPGRLYPDLQMQMVCSLVAGVFRKNWNLKGEVWDALYEHEDNKHGIYITNALLHPKSTGTIRLQNTDPSAKPLIDPRYLTEPEDARVLVEGLKLQLQLTHTQAFQKMGAKLSKRSLPGKKDELYSEAYMEKYIRHHTLTGHHATSTCKMGAPSDPTAVVDPQLRVFGLRGLRVVDASVMPKVPSGNTSAPTVMIAERAADLIRGVNSVRDIKVPDEVLRQSEESVQARV